VELSARQTHYGHRPLISCPAGPSPVLREQSNAVIEASGRWELKRPERLGQRSLHPKIALFSTRCSYARTAEWRFGALTPKTVISPTSAPRESPIELTAMAKMLPISRRADSAGQARHERPSESIRTISIRSERTPWLSKATVRYGPVARRQRRQQFQRVSGGSLTRREFSISHRPPRSAGAACRIERPRRPGAGLRRGECCRSLNRSDMSQLGVRVTGQMVHGHKAVQTFKPVSHAVGQQKCNPDRAVPLISCSDGFVGISRPHGIQNVFHS